MESLTKNRQNKNIIEAIAQKFFPNNSLSSYTELKEGFFNAAYEIRLDNNREMVLKVAPKKGTRIMTYEKNIMQSEIYAMQKINNISDIPAPRLLGADMSCTICESGYFLMEKLEGDSLNSIKSQLTDAQVNDIYYHMGQINRRINEIDCPHFGYPGQVEFQGDSWYDVFRRMLSAGISDAEKGNVDLIISTNQLMEKLQKDKRIFDEVTQPKLVHWDCWDGNIFVKDAAITGIIDWERCLWADPLMEVGFRTYDDNAVFLKGYNIKQLSEHQWRRAIWYDIYLMILVSLECEYRKYDTLEMYEWSTGVLQKQFKQL